MAADKGRIATVDGLRGLAIALVLLTHVHQALGYPYIQYASIFATVDFLRSGVDLFFVLSGFCLFYPLTKPGSRPNWPSFFRRRARRLLPPYYAAIAVLILLPFLIEPAAHRLGLVTSPYQFPDWHQVWTHLLIVHPFFSDAFYGLDSPLWSLGVEMQFYLAFPLAVWLVFRLGWRGVAVLAACTLGYRALVGSSALAGLPIDLNELFPSRWLEFGLGMLVAMQIRRAGNAPLSRRRELFDLVGTVTAYLIAAYFLYGPLDNYPYAHKDLLFSAGWAAVLYLTCSRGTVLAGMFAAAPLVWLGTISYSVYLIHFPIIFSLAPTVAAMHLSNTMNMVVLSLVALPVVLVCSAVFFHFVERPFLNTAPTGLAQALPRHDATAAQDGRAAQQENAQAGDRRGPAPDQRSIGMAPRARRVEAG